MISNQANQGKRFCFALKLFLVACAIFSFAFNANAQGKLKPEEIIAKHLEAIAPLETRNSVTTRMISGEIVHKALRSGGQSIPGKTVFASDGVKYIIAMQFDNPTYPFDRFAFDGQSATIAFNRPGQRSTLGNVLKGKDQILQLGLLGGTLSSSWTLFDLNSRNVKIGGGGTKKIDGKECYVVDLTPKKGSDLTIKLYFDAATFLHVRTTYEQVISAPMGSDSTNSARQRETRYEIREDFSDMKKEGGMMFPHTYTLYLSLDNKSSGVTELEWKCTFNNFVFNEKIDPQSFRVE